MTVFDFLTDPPLTTAGRYSSQFVKSSHMGMYYRRTESELSHLRSDKI